MPRGVLGEMVSGRNSKGGGSSDAGSASIAIGIGGNASSTSISTARRALWEICFAIFLGVVLTTSLYLLSHGIGPAEMLRDTLVCEYGYVITGSAVNKECTSRSTLLFE